MTKKFDYATPFAKTSSGIRGVSFDNASGKWVAKIGYNNRRKYLGRFNTPDEAVAAYRTAAESILEKHKSDTAYKLKNAIAFLLGPFDTLGEAASVHKQTAESIFMDLANNADLSAGQVDAICSRAFGDFNRD